MYKRKIIGVCGVQIYEQNVMPFIQILQKRSEENGFRLVFFSGSTNNPENTDEVVGQYQLVEVIRQVDICALIVLSETIINKSMIQKLLELGNDKNIPVFSLDRQVDGCYSMVMDNHSCFEQMVRHVVHDHGCKRVNMIAGIKGNSFSEERIEIYRKVLEESGILFEEERVGYGNWWERPVAGVIKKFMESDLAFPEAIVCANDIMAYAAVTVLNECGLEVPEDVIVTGYDGTKDGLYFYPSITTGVPDYERMVRWIFAQIFSIAETGIIKPRDLTVSVLLKKRQSCGCEKKMIPDKDRRISNMLVELGNEKWHMRSMHWLVSDSFGKQDIRDLIPIMREHMDVFFDFYRCIFLKKDLLDTYKESEEFSELKSLLDANRGDYREAGQELKMDEFQSYIDDVFEKEKSEAVMVHLLNSGKLVYGICVEGFNELVDWKMKQYDEFAMFVSHILHTVIHNHKMHELNQTLHAVNKEIEEMSYRDSMTGHYNRRGFFFKMRQVLQEKENEGKYLYLFMIDMDGLKIINDNFGHAEGDYAIVVLAEMLNKLGKDQAVCARVGGDEFICAFISNKPDKYKLTEYQAQLEELLMKASQEAQKPYRIAASVGMTSQIISQELDIDSLINSADHKMYKHKVARKKKQV